jgi:hypothetical protein
MIRTDRSAWTAIVAALLIVVASSAFVVAAAGATTVEIAPGETEIEVGEMRTFEIVVHDSDGGIGAAEIAAHVSDASVATIADVEIQGDPGLARVSANEDNTTVEMLYIMADTNETGPVAIAEVTVMGESSGAVEVSAGSIEGNDEIRLFDDAGERYGEVESSPVTVTVEPSNDGDTDDGSETNPSTAGSGGGDGDASSSDTSSDGDSGETDGRDAGSENDTDARGDDDERTDAENAAADDSSSESEATDDAANIGGESESSPTPTRTEAAELDDEAPVDQTGFGVLPAVTAVLAVAWLANRRYR